MFRILRQALVVFLQLCGGLGSPIFSTANSPEPYLLLNKDPIFNLLDFLEEKLWSSEMNLGRFFIWEMRGSCLRIETDS